MRGSIYLSSLRWLTTSCGRLWTASFRQCHQTQAATPCDPYCQLFADPQVIWSKLLEKGEEGNYLKVWVILESNFANESLLNTFWPTNMAVGLRGMGRPPRWSRVEVGLARLSRVKSTKPYVAGKAIMDQTLSALACHISLSGPNGVTHRQKVPNIFLTFQILQKMIVLRFGTNKYFYYLLINLFFFVQWMCK